MCSSQSPAEEKLGFVYVSLENIGQCGRTWTWTSENNTQGQDGGQHWEQNLLGMVSGGFSLPLSPFKALPLYNHPGGAGTFCVTLCSSS